MAKAKRTFNLTSKRTWRKILSIGLAILMIAAAIFGIVKLSQKMKDETKKITPTFAVGALGEDGKYIKDSKSSLYTKDSFEAKGLEVILDFDANITYEVFWYDAQGNFVKSSGDLNKGTSFYAPINHTARIEVTPIWDNDLYEEDRVIKWYEKFEYTKQLEIRVDKDQNVSKKDYKVVSFNDMKKDYLGLGFVSSETGSFVSDENSSAQVYRIVNDFDFSLLYLDADAILTDIAGTTVCFHIVTKDGEIVDSYSTSYNNANSAYYGWKPFPTIEDPLYVPMNASIYLFGDIDGLDFDNFLFGIY